MVATDVRTIVARELKLDYRRLQRAREALAELLRSPAALMSHRHQLAHWLAELRDQLAVHFALEEAAGYFDEARENAPHLAFRVAALQAEHVSLYERIRGLTDEVEQGLRNNRLTSATDFGNEEDWAQRIARRYRTFDRRLVSHEAGESELIFESLDTDLGAGD